MAQRVGRGIALLFHDCGTKRRVSGQQHAPAALYSRERPGTYFTGGWVGPRAGPDRRKISPTTGIRCPDPTARSESLYRLSYTRPAFTKMCKCKISANLKFYFSNGDIVINLDTIQMRRPTLKIEFTITI